MAARPQLPGMRWFLWLRIASLRTGILTGIYLSCVFVAWLVVANRVAGLEPFAELRNLVAGAFLIMVLGDSRASIPSSARKAFRCGPDGLDASDHDLYRGGNPFHSARKPHGGLPRFRAGRGFLRLRCRARLGVPDVRGRSTPAHGPIPGNHVLRRQARIRTNFSNPSQKEKGLDETLPFSTKRESRRRANRKFCRA